jgi:lantibiotic modifying enzyme
MLEKVKKLINEVENTTLYDEQLNFFIDAAQLELKVAGIPYEAETSDDPVISNSYVVAIASKVQMLLFPDADHEVQLRNLTVLTKNLKLAYNA